MSIAPPRAEHIGSFLRPVELLEARRQSSPGPERLCALEDAHIKRILARQKELGFEIFTDGETRRRNFMSDFTDAVEGFDLTESTPRAWTWASELERPAPVSGGAPGTAPEKAEASRVAGI